MEGKTEISSLSEAVIYDIADFYKVFGDSTRIRILYALMENELNVGELVQALNLNQSAVSHQLRVLRQNDLVKFRKDGKTIVYSLDDSHVTVLLQQGLEHILHKKVYD
ncbi:MAG: metalloregulator ArsR/SmtB family transcription factor [Clostridiales bacterium]|jgi:ArsR family transcriptional regulator|nr:metalloregulator ArsR/SmtB family transcription factor [Clostridiales bacterium]